MIYLLNAFSSTLTVVAALLFNEIANNKNTKKKNIAYAIITYMLLSLITALCYNQEEKTYDLIAFIFYPIQYTIVILLAYRSMIWKNFYWVIFYEFLVNIFIFSITNILTNFINLPAELLSSFTAIATNTIIIISIYSSRRKINYVHNHVKDMIPRHLYFLVLCAAICLCGLSTLNNVVTDNIYGKENIMNLIIVVFTFITGCIIVSLLVNVISKQHYSNTTAMLKKQVEIQIRHYDKLDKLNREMNSFRHDYINHLHSIYSLIKMKENDDALEYIEKLFDAKHKPSTIFNTGNKLADAILTDKADVLPKNTSIDYEGIIPSSIDNIDLCTILSNALDNAIEACRELTDSGEITISAQERQGYFVLTITNPTKHADFESIPTTTKTDKEHHGMGLMNIQDVARKYDGQMKTHCENGFFELSVAMKI